MRQYYTDCRASGADHHQSLRLALSQTSRKLLVKASFSAAC
jgi:hypothetical protein